MNPILLFCYVVCGIAGIGVGLLVCLPLGAVGLAFVSWIRDAADEAARERRR